MVDEVGEGVPIGEDEDKPARVDVRTKRRGGRCRWASPGSAVHVTMSHVKDEEEAGEVDADVEVEARGRRAVGDSISISDQVKNQRN